MQALPRQMVSASALLRSGPAFSWALCPSIRKGAEQEVAWQLHGKEQHTNEAQKTNLIAGCCSRVGCAGLNQQMPPSNAWISHKATNHGGIGIELLPKWMRVCQQEGHALLRRGTIIRNPTMQTVSPLVALPKGGAIKQPNYEPNDEHIWDSQLSNVLPMLNVNVGLSGWKSMLLDCWVTQMMNQHQPWAPGRSCQHWKTLGLPHFLQSLDPRTDGAGGFSSHRGLSWLIMGDNI